MAKKRFVYDEVSDLFNKPQSDVLKTWFNSAEGKYNKKVLLPLASGNEPIIGNITKIQLMDCEAQDRGIEFFRNGEFLPRMGYSAFVGKILQNRKIAVMSSHLKTFKRLQELCGWMHKHNKMFATFFKHRTTLNIVKMSSKLASFPWQLVAMSHVILGMHKDESYWNSINFNGKKIAKELDELGNYKYVLIPKDGYKFVEYMNQLIILMEQMSATLYAQRNWMECTEIKNGERVAVDFDWGFTKYLKNLILECDCLAEARLDALGIHIDNQSERHSQQINTKTASNVVISEPLSDIDISIKLRVSPTEGAVIKKAVNVYVSEQLGGAKPHLETLTENAVFEITKSANRYLENQRVEKEIVAMAQNLSPEAREHLKSFGIKI